MKKIKPISAFETEVVLIKWFMLDGTVFEEQRTVPPKTVREAKSEP